MAFIKITYKLRDKKTGKETNQTVMISDGKVLTRFSDVAVGQTTFEKMKADGKKVIFSRGVIFQFFKDLKKEEIRDLIMPDFDQGLKESAKVDASIEILDRQEELKK